MRRRSSPWFLAAALAVSLALPGIAPAQVALSRGEIDRISTAVVRVVALQRGEPTSSGSGTIVEPGGLIYTNRHVVEDADDFRIEILDDLNERPIPRYLARLVGFSSDVDFAVLQIDRDLESRAVSAASLDLPYLETARPTVQRGDRVYVFGYPGIGEGYLAFTEGAVTTIRNGTMGDERLPVWYQTDAQISPGNSGGLAVNGNSEIVGIPTAVRTEETTGGRLGGILAMDAVFAALDAGLESDRSAIAGGTTSPVIRGGRLSFEEDPYFGSATLSAGFTPDPHTLHLVSGGETDVSYIGGQCAGHAAIAPDFRLYWSGRSDNLRFFFVADNGGDTTLLINRPDGSWTCNDDAAGGSLDPMVVLDDPAPGQYDIWVGSYHAGSFVGGSLYITELDLSPGSYTRDELDYTLGPYYGAISLRAGFTPDPATDELLVGGGSVDVSYLGNGCVGYATAQPDYRLNWSGRSSELRFFFQADDNADTTILINLPDGSWMCNDDSAGTIDPMVVVGNPPEGQYDIWIGTYSRDTTAFGTLNITELDRGP